MSGNVASGEETPTLIWWPSIVIKQRMLSTAFSLLPSASRTARAFCVVSANMCVCVCVGVCVQVGFPSGIIRYKMARYRETCHAPCAKITRTTREVFTFLLAVCKSVAMLAKGTSFAMQHYEHNDHGTCGLVAMTSASHAEGRQFDPGQV